MGPSRSRWRGERSAAWRRATKKAPRESPRRSWGRAAASRSSSETRALRRSSVLPGGRRCRSGAWFPADGFDESFDGLDVPEEPPALEDDEDPPSELALDFESAAAGLSPDSLLCAFLRASEG